MSLVEEYYELNELEEVSAIWKALQIGFYACAGFLGLGCGFTLAVLRLKFDDRCYLFTEVKAPDRKVDKIDQGTTNWESDTWCDYYQFSMVSSFIVAIIWATLFLMCGKGGKSVTGLPQPWRIVWPSLIFNFTYFIISLSTAISIQQGTDFFCARKDFDKLLQTKSLLENCEPLKILKKDLFNTSLQLEVVVKTSWGCVISWLILFLLSFFRIVFVVDFQLYKICVFKIDDTVHNKKEEVLKITNYEELKKLYYDKNEERNSLSESEETLNDLESGSRKKTKIDKKSMRQHFNTVNRSQLQQNTTFYVTADLRMLKREKKRIKSSKALDGAFEKNILGIELRKPIQVQSDLDISTKTEIPKFLYEYSKRSYNDEDDEDELSSCSLIEKPEFNDDWNESGSGSEILVGDFDSNRSLRFKKRI